MGRQLAAVGGSLPRTVLAWSSASLSFPRPGWTHSPPHPHELDSSDSSQKAPGVLKARGQTTEAGRMTEPMMSHGCQASPASLPSTCLWQQISLCRPTRPEGAQATGLLWTRPLSSRRPSNWKRESKEH